jgi:hypothetical protein
MVAKIFTTLLILLPLSSQLDDIQAASTPDPVDDILALQDNDYLATARVSRTEGQSDTGESFSGSPIAMLCDGHTPSGSLLGWIMRSFWFGADIIFVMMSFQC